MPTSHEPARLEVSAALVDARGKPCPVPIIELAKALRGTALVELWADDPAAPKDLDTFLSATGHRLVRSEAENVFRAVVERTR